MKKLISNLAGATILSKAAQRAVSGGAWPCALDIGFGCCNVSADCGDLACLECIVGVCHETMNSECNAAGA